jgi:hypothetical protein
VTLRDVRIVAGDVALGRTPDDHFALAERKPFAMIRTRETIQNDRRFRFCLHTDGPRSCMNASTGRGRAEVKNRFLLMFTLVGVGATFLSRFGNAPNQSLIEPCELVSMELS